MTSGASEGVCNLQWWNATLNNGLGGWGAAQTEPVTFTINFTDAGSGKTATDSFGIRLVYTPSAEQPSTLPNSTPQPLKGGNITVG